MSAQPAQKLASFLVSEDGWIFTRVVAVDWYEALAQALPRFDVDSEVSDLVVAMVDDNKVRAETRDGGRAFEIEHIGA